MGDVYLIILMVWVFSDFGILSVVFDENIGNDWIIGEVDFFVVDNMKVCVYICINWISER